MDIDQWKIKNNQVAGYAHFDAKFGLNSSWEYINNPDKIAKHSFFPFIHHDHISYKYSKRDYERGNPQKTGVKEKVRPICYSSHIDRCIYKYYGFLLNEKYNEYVDRLSFCSSVVAYRTNLHKNNIHFAKQAIDFIKNDDCNIIVGDFKGFFDNLDHKYLKKNLCNVLGVQTLTKDWYAVFKNITKYSKWDLISLLKINSLISDTDLYNIQIARAKAKTGKTGKARKCMAKLNKKIRFLNQRELVLTPEQFKKYKKTYIQKNKPSEDDINKQIRGIPQGSAISAVLSNVYMIEFDSIIYQYINSLNGLYLRYSDDFIIIVPNSSGELLEDVRKFIFNLVDNTPGIELQNDKTQLYSSKDGIINNISNEGNHFKSSIDYLGFVFDGKEVTVRPKTISKYYYRMYRKLNLIVKCGGRARKNKIISCSELYRIYTQKGRNGEYDKSLLPQKIIKKDENNPFKSGNFFSYIDRSDRIFNVDETDVKEPIDRDIKRHMLKIRRKRDKIKLK